MLKLANLEANFCKVWWGVREWRELYWNPAAKRWFILRQDNFPHDSSGCSISTQCMSNSSWWCNNIFTSFQNTNILLTILAGHYGDDDGWLEKVDQRNSWALRRTGQWLGLVMPEYCCVETRNMLHSEQWSWQQLWSSTRLVNTSQSWSFLIKLLNQQ